MPQPSPKSCSSNTDVIAFGEFFEKGHAVKVFKQKGLGAVLKFSVCPENLLKCGNGKLSCKTLGVGLLVMTV